jgi:hypothetical protein
LAAVVKISRWTVIFIFMYVWFVTILTWNLKWYLLPFFTPPNIRLYVDSFFFLDLISYYGVILYNWCFTVAFVWQLIRVNSVSVIMTSRLKKRTILLIGNGISHRMTSLHIYVYISMYSYIYIYINKHVYLYIVT